MYLFEEYGFFSNSLLSLYDVFIFDSLIFLTSLKSDDHGLGYDEVEIFKPHKKVSNLIISKAMIICGNQIEAREIEESDRTTHYRERSELGNIDKRCRKQTNTPLTQF